MSRPPNDGLGKGASRKRRQSRSRSSRRAASSRNVSTADSEASSLSNAHQPVASTISTTAAPTASTSQPSTPINDYQLLLTPLFAAMNKITDHLFLTGVGGMTRENFRKNHIDFVVNITTEAPFWGDVESMRLPLEDDSSTNILPHMDIAVDRIHEVITKRNGHVLVHCIAGVSRSATVVIGYLMKYKRMDLRTAFNHCYRIRPVIRPNNGFMMQLINYEMHLFGRSSVYMIEADFDGTVVNVPHFFVEEHPRLVLLEVLRVKDRQQRASSAGTTSALTATTTAATTTTTTTNTTTTTTTNTTTTTTTATSTSTTATSRSNASLTGNPNSNTINDDL